jgi:hypothetical protein
MAARPLTLEEHGKKKKEIISELEQFQKLTQKQPYEGLTDDQEDIIKRLDHFLMTDLKEFLKADKKAVKVEEVLKKYWELTKEASKLLNHKGEHVKVFTATDCWGTCCTDGVCTTEKASQCQGSFTPFPSGC